MKRRKITDFFKTNADEPVVGSSSSVETAVVEQVLDTGSTSDLNIVSVEASVSEIEENTVDIGDILEQDRFDVSDNTKLRLILWKGPNTTVFPINLEGDRRRSFQQSWLSTYSWLRYSHSKKGGFCVTCVFFPPECVGLGRYQNLEILVKTPMTKYKKAIEILKNHDTLDYHNTAMVKMSGFVMTRENLQQSIANLLDQQRKEEIKKQKVFGTNSPNSSFLRKKRFTTEGS